MRLWRGAYIIDFSRSGATPMTAVFQLFHIATLAGIARAIERDAVAFVKPRKRVFSHGSGAVPREDPRVQQVIGHLSSTAFVATLAAREVARGLGDVDRLRLKGEPLSEGLLIDVELRAGKAQVVVTEAVLGAATRLFDVGGATALNESRRLDRHWRNARTLASHNPVIYKARVIGDNALNGTRPTFYWGVGTRDAGGSLSAGRERRTPPAKTRRSGPHWQSSAAAPHRQLSSNRADVTPLLWRSSLDAYTALRLGAKPRAIEEERLS